MFVAVVVVVVVVGGAGVVEASAFARTFNAMNSLNFLDGKSRLPGDVSVVFKPEVGKKGYILTL